LLRFAPPCSNVLDGVAPLWRVFKVNAHAVPPHDHDWPSVLDARQVGVAQEFDLSS
jgi:hypothetical protein